MSGIRDARNDNIAALRETNDRLAAEVVTLQDELAKALQDREHDAADAAAERAKYREIVGTMAQVSTAVVSLYRQLLPLGIRAAMDGDTITVETVLKAAGRL